MPAAARHSDSNSTGHGCTAVSSLNIPNRGVYVNGRPLARQGDSTVVHSIKVGKSCVPHTDTISSSSGSVFLGGIGAARLGDSCGGAIISGSSNVFIGD